MSAPGASAGDPDRAALALRLGPGARQDAAAAPAADLALARLGTACVARLLAQAMGSDIQPEILGRFRAGDIRNCFADITRARDLLGFVPQHQLEDSLGPFVEWVARQPAIDNGARMRAQLEERGLVT